MFYIGPGPKDPPSLMSLRTESSGLNMHESLNLISKLKNIENST